ncbi:MAG: hypothetical protein AB7Y46_00775 [Armatimonadota bacterium]
MRASSLPPTALVLAVAVIISLLTAISASAQWGRQSTSGSALSFAYSGDENGFRLEHARDGLVYDLGYFDDDDDEGILWSAEIGLDASHFIEDYGGAPFVIGGGLYFLDPDDDQLSQDEDFALWAGVGDFTHTAKGLFFQYRYIFSGPLGGSQGVVGWAF